MIDGRIVTADSDLGSGFCIADRIVVTAGHVIGNRSPSELSFLISGIKIEVDSIRVSKNIDVALLWLRQSLALVPTLTQHEVMAQWTVSSQPLGNDPALGGVITTRRKITNIHDHDVAMLQLKVDEALGSYHGYSGSAVYIGESVAAVLLEQVKERVPRTANPKGTNVLYAVPIELVVREFGLNQVIQPYQASPRPSGLLLDAAFFDLDVLKAEMFSALSRSDSRVLAFGVECAEPVFIRKLCDWLAHYLGETHCRDSLILDPGFTSVDGAVRTVLRYQAALDRVSVVCPVSADRVTGESIAKFWTQVSAECGPSERWLILLFAGRPEGGYPATVTCLPQPVFAPADVAAWVTHVASSGDWSVEMVDAWRDWILEESSDGAELSIRYTIEALEESIRLVRFRPDDLRRTLEKRSRHAHTASR